MKATFFSRRLKLKLIFIALGLSAIIGSVVFAQMVTLGNTRTFVVPLSVFEFDGNGDGAPREANKDTFIVQGPLMENGVQVGMFQCRGTSTDVDTPDDSFDLVGAAFVVQRLAIHGEGDIIGMGNENVLDPVPAMAIVGGTGKFEGVRGSYTIFRIATEPTSTLEFVLNFR